MSSLLVSDAKTGAAAGKTKAGSQKEGTMDELLLSSKIAMGSIVCRIFRPQFIQYESVSPDDYIGKVSIV